MALIRLTPLPGLALALAAVNSSHAESFRFDDHELTVPDGFVVQQAASPPLVKRPINAALDRQGRLYVTESSGSNADVEVQLENRPHRVVRLEDTDSDGRYDERVVFAEDLMLPQGALWHRGSLYVAAPPSIWRLTDTNGDGTADEREEWFQGETLTSCANDLHGPYRGPSGRIYWTKGAFAEQSYDLGARGSWTTRAAHLFRSRPDGRGIEPVMTGGMDNPVAVAFTRSGEPLLAGTFFQHPRSGRRDGLLHAAYGTLYGKDHDVLEGHPRTGALMPIMTHLGPAVPCHLIRYRSTTLGEDYRDNWFSALFNLHKILRHRLRRDGATFETEDEDFLVSDSMDFHPTCVVEGADGSLLVVDTGGWYKLCCPTSQLHKPDVLGGIYRVEPAEFDGRRPEEARSLEWDGATVETLFTRLAHPGPKVRDRAISTLAERGPAVVSALVDALGPGATEEQQLGVVWVLSRIDSSDSREAVRRILDQTESEAVQLAALHTIGLSRDGEAAGQVGELLKAESPHLKRAAMEALGRLRSGSGVLQLLQAAPATGGDRFLEHALIYALIEIGDPGATEAGLQAGRPLARRAALMALDQIDGGHLQPETVWQGWDASHPKLRATALEILLDHPEWAGALTGHLRRRLESESDLNAAEWRRLLAAWAGNEGIQRLLSRTASDPTRSDPTRELALSAMAEARLQALPGPWADVLKSALKSGRPRLIRRAVATGVVLAPGEGLSDLRGAFLKVAREPSLADETRLDAVTAFAKITGTIDATLYPLVMGHLHRDEPSPVQNAAISALEQAELTDSQLVELADRLPDLGLLERQRLISLFEGRQAAGVGRRLLEAVETMPDDAFSAEELEALFESYPRSVQEEAAEVRMAIRRSSRDRKERIDQLLESLPSGEIRRGQSLFNSPRTGCRSCHQVGYLGGELGPDLTRIGSVRTRQDLLEAVVYPELSIPRGYRTTIVTTDSGDERVGIVQNENRDELILMTGPGQSVRVEKDRIKERRRSSTSMMPEGFDRILTPQELADLLAFLEAAE